ncbi:MAG: hypothetical protein GOVbin1096_67 [Prokaryotic dsDNA virus sp.]|jgi:hypothetical protein|nr:MAG: hypothetical protein GOVbin1096_67 [Prokaryotic dsDNA virus sp.]|tara:strand:- start:351 stop:728 length:378 start_codon:yes stop_codon:yes gene_type:complete
MREQKEVQVGEDTYLLHQFGAIEGLKYQKALAQVLLPAIAEISKAGELSEESAISIGMNKLAENIDKIDERMIEAMVVRGATKNNMAVNFDNEFAGKYMQLFQLVKEIVMFNFGSVFTMLGSDVE